MVVASSRTKTVERCSNPIETALHRYDEHMKQVRGLTPSRRLRRLGIVGLMIRKIGVATPTADQLRRFITQELARMSPASGAAVATTLRSYLRFRAFEGDRIEHLLPVIGSPARGHVAPLPQTLSRADVEQLLSAFPPGMPSRLRSYAIVRCLVDLGLRTHEVSSLTLDSPRRALRI